MQVPVALAHAPGSEMAVGCSFYNNSCPRNSGAIYAEAALTLNNSALNQNTAHQVFFGTANLAELSATNTWLEFPKGQGAQWVAALCGLTAFSLAYRHRLEQLVL